MTDLSLYSSALYERGLLSPLSEGADSLLVIAGYASPSMTSQLLSDASEHYGKELDLHLVVGMSGVDGVSVDAHRGFESLHENPPAGKVRVAYMPRGRAVHTKLYVWMKNDKPVVAYAGSSNFTHNGFLLGRARSGRDELLAQVPVEDALAEFRRIENDSISIDHPDLLDEVLVRRQVAPPEWTEAVVPGEAEFHELLGLPSVVLPLVMTGGGRDKVGQVHLRSGLNWGQRPEVGREPNQAYIPIPAQIARTQFFPPRGVQFLVNTDDNKAIIMVVAEDGDKALHSPQGNQLIGEYFRYRLGLPNGAPVALDDLERFGSRFVRFYQLDDDTYYMEYDPDVEAAGSAFYGI